jgi:predicted nucleic acid-binding protein
VAYLLDTNVISEFSKLTPDASLLKWIAGIHEQDLFLSTFTLGEINKGLTGLDSPRKAALEQWLSIDVIERFGDRILSFDQESALSWGRLVGQSSRTLPVIDSLIAAIAMTHQLTLVTRNIKDFVGLKDLRLLNPFS